MTVQWGDTGKVAYGPFKKFTFSFATPRETLQGSPTALPSANPGSPQISYTIQASDLPTISPNPLSVVYCAVLIVGGKNIDAASQSVNYQCYKNGATVSGASGSQSVSANTFWTHTHYRFYNVSVGDVIGVSVWSASANMNYDYYALMITPSRPSLGTAYINKDVYFAAVVNPVLTLGTPSVVWSQSPVVYPSDTTATFNVNGACTFAAWNWKSTYNAFQATYSDQSLSTNTDSHATYRPYYRRPQIPSYISFREVLR